MKKKGAAAANGVRDRGEIFPETRARALHWEIALPAHLLAGDRFNDRRRTGGTRKNLQRRNCRCAVRTECAFAEPIPQGNDGNEARDQNRRRMRALLRE